MKDVTPASMSKAEAEEVTTRIRAAVEDIRKLVAQAHEGKAWKALGYKSWEAYVKAEFGMSRSYAHRLVEHGEVIEAIESAVGDLSPMGNISERAARELKADIPAATAEIRHRVEQGEKPEEAAKDIAAQRRAEKEAAKAERDAQKAENNRQRQEARSKLNPEIHKREQAKAEAIAARKAEPIDAEAIQAELEELREACAALDAENARLKAENAKWEDMRVQYEAGGFDKVVADMGEQIRVLRRQVETESQEKVRNLNSFNWAMKKLRETGWSNEEVIDLDNRSNAR